MKGTDGYGRADLIDGDEPGAHSPVMNVGLVGMGRGIVVPMIRILTKVSRTT